MDSIHNENFILAVPSVYIAYAGEKRKKFILAAQDCSVFEGYGAHTGEISAEMIKEAGAEYVILGHSERRATSNFDNVNSVYKKLNNAINAGLKVILCVDEDFESLLDQKTKELIKGNLNKIVVAYEPMSAIGTGKLPSATDIETAVLDIKNKCYNVKTLYGGSVNAENIRKILGINVVDGVLIGGSSLRLDEIKKFLTN
jgi:triosephosphate isomerase